MPGETQNPLQSVAESRCKSSSIEPIRAVRQTKTGSGPCVLNFVSAFGRQLKFDASRRVASVDSTFFSSLCVCVAANANLFKVY